MDLVSRPWIHDDERYANGLVQTLPSFSGGRRGIYDEKLCAVANELRWDAR
jgi:hypothetical protein